MDEFIKIKGDYWSCSICKPPYDKGVGWQAARHCTGAKHQKRVKTNAAAGAVSAVAATGAASASVSSTAAAAAVAAATAATAAERANHTLTPARAAAAAALSSIVSQLAVVPPVDVSPFMLSPGVMGMVRVPQRNTAQSTVAQRYVCALYERFSFSFCVVACCVLLGMAMRWRCSRGRSLPVSDHA